MSLSKLIIASVAFQLAWLIAVIFGNVAAIIVTVGMWFLNNYLMPFQKRHLCFMACVIALGIIVDTFFEISGILVFPTISILPPIWLVCLWVLFSMLLVVVLPRIISQLMLFTILSMLGGSISYIAGVALSDVELGVSQTIAYFTLFVIWFFLGLAIHFLYKISIGFESEDHEGLVDQTEQAI